jgi:CRISPR-associated protein Cas2
MFVVITYDVQKPRGPKVMKYLRRHLHHVQESVFVGEVTHKTMAEITSGISRIIKDDSDRVIIMKIASPKALKTEILGRQQWIETIL